MTVHTMILLLFLPLRFASITNAALSKTEFNTVLDPLEKSHKKDILAKQALRDQLQLRRNQYEKFLDDETMDEECIELEREKYNQLVHQTNAKIAAIEEEADKFEEEFHKMNPVLLSGYTDDYEIESLKKTLTIFQNPSLSRQSKKSRSGGEFLSGYMVLGAARMIAKYLEMSSLQKPWLPGKKILDLGAGTGYLGIVAACLGGDVTVADLPAMIPFMQDNIDANAEQLDGTGGKIQTQSLRWGNEEDLKSLPKQDIILLSGPAHDITSVEPLVSTLVALSDADTILVVCQDKFSHLDIPTSVWDAFYSQASKYFDLSPIRYFPILPNGDIGYHDVWLMQGNFKRETPSL